MTKEEIQEVAERFGDTYNREGNGQQMAWAFESGADWAQSHLVHKPDNEEGITAEELEHQLYGAKSQKKLDSFWFVNWLYDQVEKGNIVVNNVSLDSLVNEIIDSEFVTKKDK